MTAEKSAQKLLDEFAFPLLQGESASVSNFLQPRDLAEIADALTASMLAEDFHHALFRFGRGQCNIEIPAPSRGDWSCLLFVYQLCVAMNPDCDASWAKTQNFLEHTLYFGNSIPLTHHPGHAFFRHLIFEMPMRATVADWFVSFKERQLDLEEKPSSFESRFYKLFGGDVRTTQRSVLHTIDTLPDPRIRSLVLQGFSQAFLLSPLSVWAYTGCHDVAELSLFPPGHCNSSRVDASMLLLENRDLARWICERAFELDWVRYGEALADNVFLALGESIRPLWIQRIMEITTHLALTAAWRDALLATNSMLHFTKSFSDKGAKLGSVLLACHRLDNEYLRLPSGNTIVPHADALWSQLVNKLKKSPRVRDGADALVKVLTPYLSEVSKQSNDRHVK